MEEGREEKGKGGGRRDLNYTFSGEWVVTLEWRAWRGLKIIYRSRKTVTVAAESTRRDAGTQETVGTVTALLRAEMQPVSGLG